MISSNLRIFRAPSAALARFSVLLIVATGLLLPSSLRAQGPEAERSAPAPVRLVRPIDEHALVTLKGNVRRDLTRDRDLGPVEDSMPLHLFLLLQRTPAQEASLQNLLARQQEPGAPEYHKWLTPKEFGGRFGAAPEDIATLTAWLESHGFSVRHVLNNASMIDFAATSRQVREAFHTQMHYWKIRGGKYAANAQDPQIPAALASVVAGVKGFDKVPPRMGNTALGSAAYDASTHRGKAAGPTGGQNAKPAWADGAGRYNVSPHDLYTIYNVNPVFAGGNLADTATVAVIEESDMQYGTVDSTFGVATGGDVVTFRNTFGVPGRLNMRVFHGYGSVPCNAPGIDPNGIGEDFEASLDAEWINATAPSAILIFMACDDVVDNGIFTSMAALIDNNLSDVMSMSYIDSEFYYSTPSAYNFQDTLYTQAAAQGQTFFVSSGDSGSDAYDQNSGGTAIAGTNVNALGSPLTTIAGGTDFQDDYDRREGGADLETYWGTNSANYADALSYVPETAWNGSCASSLQTVLEGYTGAGYCATGNETNGEVVAGSGGFSTHYTVPAWQTGISGYSGAMLSEPDVSGFASYHNGGESIHALVFCDSTYSDSTCADATTFGTGGGTSFVAPYLAGVTGLLVTATGSRQGAINPALYALAKAQYTAPTLATACYANGQPSNTGVTESLPSAACIFNDVTTGNNDVACAAGSTECYVDPGATYGMISLTGSSSLTVAYESKPGYDQVTGIGTVNVSNLITKWNSAFTSSTGVSVTNTTINALASTELTASVTGGAPIGYVGTLPPLTGNATFNNGPTNLGTCTLSSGSCSITVFGSALNAGTNNISATFTGSASYPSSTSSLENVTLISPAAIASPAAGSALSSPDVTFNWNTAYGATGYYLQIGSAGFGSGDIYNSTEKTVTSYTFTSMPVNGEIIYVRLTTDFNGTLLYDDTAYTAATDAAMISPAANGTLSGPSQVFTWNAAAGATGYYLQIGTSGTGSEDLYNSGLKTGTTYTFTKLPTDGETIYVRLITNFGGAWVHNDYTYTAAAQALLTSPTQGATIAGTSVTFTWSAAPSATSYYLLIGSNGAGSNNIYNSAPKSVTSFTFSALPANAETLYVRLTTNFNGAWISKDYTFQAAGSAATMISPAGGSVFSGPSATFTWSAPSGVTGYYLQIGTAGVGSEDVYNSGLKTATTYTFTKLPTNGAPIYVRLITNYNGIWVSKDYTYTATAPAAMTSPVQGTTFAGSSVTFNWTTAAGATGYYVWIGTTGAGSNDLYNSELKTGTSFTFNAMPTKGQTIYVRLITNFNGAWVSNDYTYTAS